MARLFLLLLHNLLLPGALLFMAPAALRKMKARGGHLSDLWQRFGFFTEVTHEKLRTLRERSSILWLHAASVGEVGMATKLVRELLRVNPDLGIVLTTTTPTGFAEAMKVATKHPGQLVPLYSALDGWFIVRRFIKVIRPSQMVLVESEIWPNVLYACVRRGIPVSIVNARLSPRSEARYQKVKPLAEAVFSMFSRVYVQEPEDISRWATLGVLPENISHPGSIKFDTKGQAEPVAQMAVFAGLLSQLGWPEEASILLAASTHPGEEVEIAKVFLKIKATHPYCRLLVVPRHVERGAVLLEELRATGMSTVRRSTLQLPVDHTSQNATPDCLLVDTTGELRAWQYLATAVVVGKSFLAKGGQNPAEAVMAGKPVFFGPHMENFESLVRHLKSRGGAIQVSTFAKLEEKLLHLLRHTETAEHIAIAGQEALRPHEGATRRIAESLLK